MISPAAELPANARLLKGAVLTIKILPPHVSERIAAGEVIERPASIVKEAVENSIDAGATEITVFLQDGGKSLIEISDNGQGMGPEDLALCVKRHATSKLNTFDDLETLSTLGFRGEALPSIAAVSALTIVSRARQAELGDAYELAPEAQAPRAVTAGSFVNTRHGTRLRAEGLFSQLPARLKFLKSPSSEVTQVREWIERLALAHPQIGFKLVSDDRTLLNLRPEEKAARVRSVLAADADSPLVTAESEAGSQYKIQVYWLQGLSLPQTRKIAQVVNGRSVRDRLLQQAMLSPFRQALLPGQFPALALFLEVDPSQLDVNVHPTKTELRFLESSRIFRAVQSLIEAMIVKHGAPAFAAGAPAFAAGAGLPPPFTQTGSWSTSEPGSGYWSASDSQDAAQFEFPSTGQPVTPASASLATESLLPLNAYVGTLFNTYLLFDVGEELRLVDQHAAHERIRYEDLRRSFDQAGSRQSQALLIPEAVHFDAEERPRIEARLAPLLEFGFEAEVFGETSVLFRAVPSAWGTDDLRNRLKSLVARLMEADTEAGQRPQSQGDSKILMDENLFETLASQACHSAIRAGDRLEKPEAEALVSRLFRCTHPWNCPHGRPTVVRVPRARFEEWFLRRV